MTLAQQVPPAVVILDIGIPDMDTGLVLSHLRSNAATRHIPIVLCSSSEPVLRGWEAEVDGCWLKLVLYDDFVNTLVAIGAQGRHPQVRKEAS